MRREFIRGGVTTVILAVLAERSMHGYELIQEIRSRTDGIFDFGDGTVYPLLYALRDRGLLRSREVASDDGRARKIYELTAAGRTELSERVTEWRNFAEGMRLALGQR